MRNVEIEELSLESFADFGYFANMLNPKTPRLGDKPIEFFRDMLQLDLGNATKASFSVCRVEKRPEIVDITEYHNSCGEANLPLDHDVLMHVAPATALGDVPYDKIRIFRVPQGTLVILKPGVWHHAMFADKSDYANVLVILPERLYAIDCVIKKLNSAEMVKIQR